MSALNFATPVFPNNVILLMKDAFTPDMPADGNVVLRPVRPTDANVTVGLFANLWTPQTDSYEMRGQIVPIIEPTLDRYTVVVQGLYKHADQEAGLAGSSVLSEWLRSMLYRDEPLRVGLTSLATSVNGVNKRIKRFEVGSQRYLSNEVSGIFNYLSTLEYSFETETS